MRINKYLADKQYASRRGADTLITDGRVFINGEVAKLGDQVSEKDTVVVKGMERGEPVYYAYYKPRGIVTMGAQDGEKEIKDVTTFPETVYPLGRLDKESEGLLLFTNDGRLTDALLRPESEHEKEYEVTVDKDITSTFVHSMHKGVPIGAVGKTKNYITKQTLIRKKDAHTFDVVLIEGKNRQIRRMCRALGYEVEKLKRFRVINIELGNLKAGEYRKIEGGELADFLSALNME